MHQIGILIMNAEPENQYAITAKKGHFAKICRSKHSKQQEFKGIAEPDDTEPSHTDKSIKILTEIKHIADRTNHIIMTLKINATEKKFIADTGSPVTIILLDK